MSYTQTEWSNGDVITAEKLNNLEDGVQEALQGGGSELFEVNMDFTTSTLDKTWQEINDAFPNVVVYLNYNSGSQNTYRGIVLGVQDTHFTDGHYSVFVNSGTNTLWFTTTSASGYPEKV